MDVPSRSPAATLLKELPAIALGTPPRSPVSASWGRCLAALRARSPDRAELDDWQQAVEDGRPVAQRDLVLWPSLHRRAVSLQRDQIVADAGNLLDQVLAGRIVPAVNGVGVVGHGAILPHSIRGRVRAIFPPCRPAASSKKDSPAKLAGRMKRRWRVVLLRAKGEILGTVEAPDVASAKAAAAVQFGLDEIQRNRIMVQELAWSAERRAVQRAERGRANYKWLGSRDIAQ